MRGNKTAGDIERVVMYSYPSITRKLDALKDYYVVDRSGAISIMLEMILSNSEYFKKVIDHYWKDYQIQVKQVIDTNERSIPNVSLNIPKHTKGKVRKLIDKEQYTIKSFSEFLRAMIDLTYNENIAPKIPEIEKAKKWFEKHKKIPEKIIVIDPGDEKRVGKIAVIFGGWE